METSSNCSNVGKLALLSESAKSVLAEIYGDLNAYLETKIEAEVRAQKQRSEIITLGEPITAELIETPDVTSVAATTAAATAAAVVQATVSRVNPVGGADSPVGGRGGSGNVNSRPRSKHRPTGRETGGNRPGSDPLVEPPPSSPPFHGRVP